MTSFHFSAGNSSNGPIGLCLRVNAKTQERAVELANLYIREQLAHEQEQNTDSDCCGSECVEYCTIYLNPEGGLVAADIDEINECFDTDNRIYPTQVGDCSQNRALYANPSVEAIVKSDDAAITADFLANRWLSQASDAEILELKAIDWGGNRASDEVAFYMESRNLDVELFMEYVRHVPECGFECHVDGEQALCWIGEHRKHLLSAFGETTPG